MDPIAAKAETEDTGSPMVSCHNALVRFVVFGKLAELFLSSYLGCRICLGAGIYTRHVFLTTSKNDNLCFFQGRLEFPATSENVFLTAGLVGPDGGLYGDGYEFSCLYPKKRC